MTLKNKSILGIQMQNFRANRSFDWILKNLTPNLFQSLDGTIALQSLNLPETQI